MSMVEELLIKIKSTMDNNGFSKAEASMRGLQGSSKQALGEAAAHSGFFNAEMNKSPGILDRAKNSMNQLGISTQQLGMGMVAAGAAIIAAYAMIAYMAVQAAAQSEQNWGRLTVALGKTGMEMESVKADYKGMVDSIASDTARSRGDIISAIGNLARVGVVNKEIAKTSVEAMGALAMIKYPGDPQGFNTISEAWTNLINKPTIMAKSLTTLGIDTKKFDQVLQENGLTMKDWTNLTTDQRTALLNQTVALQGGAAANELYKHSYQGVMQSLTNLWQQFITSVGYELLPILKDLANWAIPILTAMLKGFQALPGPVKMLILVLPLVLGVLLLIGGAVLLLAPFAPVIMGIAGAFGILGASEGTAAIAGWAALAPLLAIAALGVITVYVAVIAAKAAGFAGQIQETYKDPVRTAAAGVSSFGSQLPLPAAMRMITGKGEYGAKDEGANWEGAMNGIRGVQGALFGGGTASAAGSGGNKGMMNDIFGKNGLTDFTRQTNQIKSGWNGAMNYIKGVTSGVENYIKGAWNNTTGFVTGLYNRLRGAWGGTVAYIQGAWANTVASVSGAWANTIAYIGGAWSNTVAWVVGGASQIYSAGANAFWGIYNAVVGALAAAWSYIQSFVSSAVNALQQVWSSMTGGGWAGDPHTANNLTGASGSAHMATNLTNSGGSTNVTHNHTWNIGSVDSKETADYLVDQVIQRFTKENNIRGN